MQASHLSWNGSAARERCTFRRWFRMGRNERNGPKKETMPWFRRGRDDQRWLGRAPDAPSVPPRLAYGPWLHSRSFGDCVDRKVVHASSDACNAHQAVTSVHKTSTRTVLVSRPPKRHVLRVYSPFQRTVNPIVLPFKPSSNRISPRTRPTPSLPSPCKLS